ncbi:MAG: methyltransferase domain-containing protein, partial [Pseudomonas stutzeri]|nr:methyltransferase domain-containing protein [Stutzerimonas stutzeri]
ARAAGVVQAPGERLPFPDATFDVVFSHEVLEHVADDRACVAEMVRVTRPGGRIVVFVPNRLYPF